MYSQEPPRVFLLGTVRRTPIWVGIFLIAIVLQSIVAVPDARAGASTGAVLTQCKTVLRRNDANLSRIKLDRVRGSKLRLKLYSKDSNVRRSVWCQLLKGEVRLSNSDGSVYSAQASRSDFVRPNESTKGES